MWDVPASLRLRTKSLLYRATPRTEPPALNLRSMVYNHRIYFIVRPRSGEPFEFGAYPQQRRFSSLTVINTSVRWDWRTSMNIRYRSILRRDGERKPRFFISPPQCGVDRWVCNSKFCSPLCRGYAKGFQTSSNFASFHGWSNIRSGVELALRICDPGRGLFSLAHWVEAKLFFCIRETVHLLLFRSAYLFC